METFTQSHHFQIDLELQSESKSKGNDSQDEAGNGCCKNSSGSGSINHHGDCAICLNTILLQEIALVKGCEHAYCVNCILRWASYKNEPTCPQCKNPFAFLHINRSLDGSNASFQLDGFLSLHAFDDDDDDDQEIMPTISYMEVSERSPDEHTPVSIDGKNQ